MRLFELTADQRLNRPLDEVFAFFAEPANLQELTPEWLRFEILTPGPIPMREGTRIDYGLRLHGLPLRWRSEISAFEPPYRFVDEQRRGPYRLWVHEHRFYAVGTGTRVLDRVLYAPPGGVLADRLFVRGQLERIFRYRQERLAERFEALPGATVRLRRIDGDPRSSAGPLYDPGR